VPGEPGFEMKEFKGFHVSSCGNFWGSEPFTPESEKEMRQWQKKREWKEKIKKLRINS
jgi:hypothetical protein